MPAEHGRKILLVAVALTLISSCGSEPDDEPVADDPLGATVSSEAAGPVVAGDISRSVEEACKGLAAPSDIKRITLLDVVYLPAASRQLEQPIPMTDCAFAVSGAESTRARVGTLVQRTGSTSEERAAFLARVTPSARLNVGEGGVKANPAAGSALATAYVGEVEYGVSYSDASTQQGNAIDPAAYLRLVELLKDIVRRDPGIAVLPAPGSTSGGSPRSAELGISHTDPDGGATVSVSKITVDPNIHPASRHETQAYVTATITFQNRRDSGRRLPILLGAVPLSDFRGERKHCGMPARGFKGLPEAKCAFELKARYEDLDRFREEVPAGEKRTWEVLPSSFFPVHKDADPSQVEIYVVWDDLDGAAAFRLR